VAVLLLESGRLRRSESRPLSVTVPVEDCAPPVTVVGFSVSEEKWKSLRPDGERSCTVTPA